MENKRVVLINGNTTSWFEQAIVIVKDGQMRDGFEGGRPTPSLVEQAEKIVNSYNPFKEYQNFSSMTVAKAPKPAAINTSNNTVAKKSSKNSRIDIFLNLSVLIGCVVLAGVLITQL